MARINIEDSIYKDVRFMRLVIALNGDIDRALGALVRAWSLAQEWYLKTPDRMIPLNEWRTKEINNILIDVGLAELVGERVRVKGIDEQFAWLVQKSEAGKRNREIIKKSRRRTLTPDHRATSSFSSSSSSSFSNSSSNTFLETKGASAGADDAPTNLEIKSPVGVFIASYVKAYQSTYGPGARPNLIGKVQGQIKVFLKDTQLDRACRMIQKYCEMPDRWFLTKGHDFTTFMENLSKVGLALDTGIDTTATKTKAEQVSDYNADMHKKILRGEL